jgi:UDP-N-acetylglucosamine--N-acetylmuramyl-(pentapeptide) pyrophosphoryl-undecaprenol N-acetylglucosamine transferase
MKALLVITGRGIGGDARVGLNVTKALENEGLDCEIALDHNAPGLLYKKNGYSWHKISIPQAGGHAASKLSTVKAGVKTLKAVRECKKLINEVKPDVIVGIIGGGAVIGCLAAKLAKIPAVGLIDTPLDSKVCSKLNHCIVLPENQLFKSKNLPKNLEKSFFPLTPGITKGNKSEGLKRINEHIQKNPNNTFDENKKTILFSSGSSLFEMSAKALENFTNVTEDEYNILLVGDPLKKEYLNMVDNTKVINLGYIDWIKDCYALTDLAVLTDDGNMIQEAMACELPSIALTKVKYGRYHNMAAIFPGAVIESDIEDLNEKIFSTLNNLDSIQSKTTQYSQEVLSAGKKIANIIINEVNKNNKN